MLGTGKRIVRRSNRIHLRPFRRSDFRSFVALERENEEFLAPWVPTPPPDRFERKRFLRQLKHARRAARQGTFFRFGIFRSADEAILGNASVSGIHYGALWNCYVGYWIGERYNGQGFMTEALCLLFDFLFTDLRLHRAQLAIMPRNAASRRVVEKLGLREEGIARRYLKIAGAWEDHIRYAILAEEYVERCDDLNRRFLRDPSAVASGSPP